MDPLISVIVPIYKVELYLCRCVDSLLNQSYRNLEIILVDDGSPDRCGEICDSYQAKDPRVISLHKPNGGLSDARNHGIERATGGLIAFIDSDDWLPPHHFHTLYNLLIAHNADIAVGNYISTSDSAAEIPTNPISISEYNNIEALALYFTKLRVPMLVAWGKLYKRELFKDIRYPVGKLNEDEYTTHKLVYFAKKIVYTTEPLLFYFQRNDSIMGKGFDIRKRLAYLEALEERLKFFHHHGVHDFDSQLNRLRFLLSFKLDHFLLQHKAAADLANIKIPRQQLKFELDRCQFNLRFRIFYKLYFLNPALFLFFYNLLKKSD